MGIDFCNCPLVSSQLQKVLNVNINRGLLEKIWLTNPSFLYYLCRDFKSGRDTLKPGAQYQIFDFVEDQIDAKQLFILQVMLSAHSLILHDYIISCIDEDNKNFDIQSYFGLSAPKYVYSIESILDSIGPSHKARVINSHYFLSAYYDRKILSKLNVFTGDHSQSQSYLASLSELIPANINDYTDNPHLFKLFFDRFYNKETDRFNTECKSIDSDEVVSINPRALFELSKRENYSLEAQTHLVEFGSGMFHLITHTPSL